MTINLFFVSHCLTVMCEKHTCREIRPPLSVHLILNGITPARKTPHTEFDILYNLV